MSEFNELKGKTLIKIEQEEEKINFHVSDGSIYTMNHLQDCCEYVCVEDINGDLDDLVGYPLLQANEVTSDATGHDGCESGTWTLYKFATIKGYVTIRWFGASNGYYSEGVDVYKTREEFPIKEHRKLKLNEIKKVSDS